jgi:GTP pyrophosphokinase
MEQIEIEPAQRKAVEVKPFTVDEERQIKTYFELLLRSCPRSQKPEAQERIKKAFRVAHHAHRYQRRKTGEPYIFHPLEVAMIVGNEIKLGTTSVVCAILHDVVEDNPDEYSIEKIRELFDEKTAFIVESLTKIRKLDNEKISKQSKNFINMLLSIPKDIRVIFIKIADRLHNLRTLDGMIENKQSEKSAETLFIYAPLAHRLGLYNIRSELENLSFKYREPEKYDELVQLVAETQGKRNDLFEEFTHPVRELLIKEGFKFTLNDRNKSLYTTYQLMKKKGIPFEELHNFSAIRIIFEPKENVSERIQCYHIYAVVTGIYPAKCESLRDNVDQPRTNGFEALIVDVMGGNGNWIEVQIMSKRMNELADRGYAAREYFNKNNIHKIIFDNWICSITEQLDNCDNITLDILDDFQLNLFSSEIYIFTPKGEIRQLPQGATALDFAFSIHQEIGLHAVQARINYQIKSIDTPLNSHDQVEIITSDKQLPEPKWLSYVKTGKAKSILKKYYNTGNENLIRKGKDILEKSIYSLNISLTDEVINKLVKAFACFDMNELYFKIGENSISTGKIKNELKKESLRILPYIIPYFLSSRTKQAPFQVETKRFDGKRPLEFNPDLMKYSLGSCCNPLANESAIGHLEPDGSFTIHESNCSKAIWLGSNDGEFVVNIKWTKKTNVSFLKRIELKGIDRPRLIFDISSSLSQELNINIKSMSISTKDGSFEGHLDIFVYDKKHLKDVTERLKKVESVNHVKIIDIIDY